jgi:uncharacterized protein (DUF302 family)
MSEAIIRIKADIAAKGIRFFDEIDQSKLAADAGIKLRPSTLLVFGNPPLGALVNIFGLAMKFGIAASELREHIYAYPTFASDIRHMLGHT